MIDREVAIEKVQRFLTDETKKVLLVKGYDNDAKLNVVLACLNKIYKKGIIRTSSMSEVGSHINRALNKDILPHNVKSTTNYRLGKMVVNINSYSNHTKSNHKGNQSTFTLYHPVQTVLDNPKRYANFLNDLKSNNSSKIILVTTNEWGIVNWELEKQVDEVFFYSVENDNPQIMKNLKRNGAI
ncbi:hypothetical protein N780_10250 [Pontibacillus chungwhensis BH030062]|uniref:Uncharacterized protein n=1 Tax=Pontibacillus chungwhensis BH030062 TaxID=1385513 RepID=A0A0A2UNY6_9BACI|nr:hypothetical protein [Pontibacillus chungwhensis]KGP89659.1 hypothetical protein N780_10250 [Pontibacillus chungwhensis BH030062]